ncbi:Metallo-dependent phosphatase-like protein [Pseudohyphozyma bogoriensis]|nr:Metallo-dependent phosphatase-like protein [Pseudohyphozyma bogoriensis]
MLFKSSLLLAVAALAYGQTLEELPPLPQDLSTPYAIRLGFNGATGMNVGWSTYEQLEAPTVYFGTHPHTLQRSASSASSVTYPTSRMWANTVSLTGLLPATTYYYKITSTNSTIGSFTTAREPGDYTPYSVMAAIDMGIFGIDGLSTRTTGYTGKAISSPLQIGEHTTIQRLVEMQDEYEFVLHPGDFAYADAWSKELKANYINGTTADGVQIYEGLTEQFFDQLGAVSSIKPYMVTAGNHEANCDNSKDESTCVVGQTKFTGFINRFSEVMPSSIDASATSKRALTGMRAVQQKARRQAAAQAASLSFPGFWYAPLAGPEDVGGSSGATDGPLKAAGQQLAWLEADFASINRTATPWVVAAGHRPWYVDSGACTVCQEQFEDIFIANNVDLVVNGHVHNMQRVAPIAKGVLDPNGYNNPSAPMYIVNGAAGHWEGLDSLASTRPSYIDFAEDTVYGFNKLTFVDKHNLIVEFIENINGTVIDSVVLYKQH